MEVPTRPGAAEGAALRAQAHRRPFGASRTQTALSIATWSNAFVVHLSRTHPAHAARIVKLADAGSLL